MDQPAARRTLFIECTNTYRSAVQTGIQRVVRNTLRQARTLARERGYEAAPVVLVGGQLRIADFDLLLRDRLRDDASATPQAGRRPRDLVIDAARGSYRAVRQGLAVVLPHPAVRRFLFAHPANFGLGWSLRQPALLLKRMLPKRPVVPADPSVLNDGLGISLDSYPNHSGNALLLIDGSFSIPIWPAVARFQAAGGSAHVVVHDLVPITHPETVGDGMTTEFTAWIKQALRQQTRFLSVSRTVATQLGQYLAGLTAQGFPAVPSPPRAFHLGSELDFSDPSRTPRPEVQAVLDGDEHVFIVVGSVEPRKNHRYILDAFDLYWRAGGTGRLAIIGRVGWKTEDLVARITGHPLYARRLFLLRDVDDSELGHAYSEASALVIASIAEGFGLPVVEAFQRGLPVLCSDIAVFRETAEGRATFFDLASPQNLADALLAFSAAHDPAQRRVRDPQPWITWRESTEQLLDAVLGPKPAAPDAAHAA